MSLSTKFNEVNFFFCRETFVVAAVQDAETLACERVYVSEQAETQSRTNLIVSRNCYKLVRVENVFDAC